MPNNWKLDSGGKLIKDFETEEFKAAVGFARDLWQAGLWHPNTPTYGGTYNNDFMAGRFAVARASGASTSSSGTSRRRADPNAQHLPDAPVRARRRQAVLPGGLRQLRGHVHQAAGLARAASRCCCAIANHFAAPFGTEEWLLNYFGVKDTDFTFNADGAPVLTEQGRAELTAAWRYVTSPRVRAVQRQSARRSSPRSRTPPRRR